MTRTEQKLADEKMRQEIARLSAETARLSAETAKIERVSQWIPAILASAAILGVLTIAKLLL